VRDLLKPVLAVAVAILGAVRPGLAPRAADNPYEWKLTLGEYFYSSYSGSDVNLRWRNSDTDAWVGVYSDAAFGTQWRTGADTSLQVTKYLQVQPSLQLASGGFVGGSVNLQIGADWYGIAGIGRTDARPYFNLNFDPNDAVTLGVGHSQDNGWIYSAFVVADDRFHTGQRDWHANARIPFGASRATVDVLYKSGLSDAGRITAWGGSLTYDWSRWFARLAFDPYQNFSAQSAWRLAGGIRF
jgi:hypothetical protein